MSKTAVIQARIEPDLKGKGDVIIKKLGLTTSQVVNALYSQIVMNKGLPFELKVPNEQTRKTLKESQQGKGLTYSNSAKEMIEKCLK